MFNNYLLKKLVAPDDSNLSLKLSDETNLFVTEKGHSYPIIDNVPILLPSKSKEITSNSKLHDDVNTLFNYIDHYQIDAEIEDYFHEFAGERAHENRRLHETISKYVPKSTKNLLDVGCGSGWVAEKFCKSHIHVVSMDVALVNPKKVLAKYPFENHTAITADVFHLPFEKETFDCIIASEIIEHVPDPQLFIKNLYDALAPDGTLIITTPYNEKIIYTVCVHCNKPTPMSAHLHSMNEKNVTGFLKELSIPYFKISKFSNKYLIKLRSFIILRSVSRSVWSFFDSLFNMVLGNETRMLIKITKQTK